MGGSWRKPKVAEPPASPVGSILAKIHDDDLQDISGVDEDAASISEFTEVASFNWLNEKKPTILIPGKCLCRNEDSIFGLTREYVGAPPAWTPLPNPTQLKEDAGEYFRDQNAARYPSYPMQPAVEAILSQNPEFPTGSVDIVACGSTIGNLLRFIRKIDHEYRMFVEVVGSTVFFIRRENSPTQVISNVYGFGHTFPEAYTTWPVSVKRSESSQRLIQYSFGEMKCVVRFEADGYLPEFVPERAKSPQKQLSNNGQKVDADKELSSALDNAILGTQSAQGKSLTRRDAGDHIPHAALFDLKTRSIRKKGQDVLGEELPRLWVSQVPHFVLAFHSRGKFGLNDMEIRDVRDDIAQWEKKNKDDLRRLVVLLKLLVAFARTQRNGRFELVHEKGGRVLELREVCDDVSRTLPRTLSDRWAKEDPDSTGDDYPESDTTNEVEDLRWESEPEKDFTACDADCGYCGHCRH